MYWTYSICLFPVFSGRFELTCVPGFGTYRKSLVIMMFDLGCHPRLCGKGIALTNSIYHPFPDPQPTTCLKICLSLQVYSKKKTVVKQTKVIFIIPGTPPSEVRLLNNNVTPKDEIDMHGSFLTARESQRSPRVMIPKTIICYWLLRLPIDLQLKMRWKVSLTNTTNR